MSFSESALNWLKNFSIKTALVVGSILVGILLVKIASKVLDKIFVKAHIDKAAGSFIKSLIKSLIWLAVVFLVGFFIGIPITALVAIISAATVAIGLALQGSLSNLASGIVIAVTKPFIEGDFIELEGVSGKVKEIKLFNTHLNTIDNKVIIVPNSTISSSNIINYTNQSMRMLNMTIPVSYTSDTGTVREILLGIVREHPLTIKNKDMICEIHEYGESSINYVLRAWTNTADYWAAYWSINESIINEFRHTNIEIPYSKLDVFIKSA